MKPALNDFPMTAQFRIIDTIGVPHPYCITPRHVVMASDHHNGILGVRAIEDAERLGTKCGVRGCRLLYKQHEQALLVEVDDDRELNDIPELTPYLLSCKDLAIEGKYAGFSVIKKRSKEGQ